MKSIFITEDDEIVINFAFAETKDDKLVADISKKFLKETFGETLVNGSVQEHKAVFKRPAFGDIIDMGSDLSTSDGNSLTFDMIKIRGKRMQSLIKSWTLKDGDKDIAATSENINKLDPTIAYVIGVQLDAAIGT